MVDTEYPSWTSYPHIYALGHKAISQLLEEPVVVEEKVDGSQISFGVYGVALRIKSRSKELVIDAPEKMFNLAVESIKTRLPLLRDGWTYCGEYLNSKSHNTLCYDRVPSGNIVIFDVRIGNEAYLNYEQKSEEAARIQYEVVPKVFEGKIGSPETVRAFLDRESFLGGQKIEGVVLKNYQRFGIDGKAMFGKFVSEAFKEIHQGTWKDKNPGKGEFIAQIIAKYKTHARWNKSIQHLKEAGQIEDSPKDIGKLMIEVRKDLMDECGEQISLDLFSHFWKDIQRGVVAGLPEYYKQQLLEKQFETAKTLTVQDGPTVVQSAESSVCNQVEP